MKLNAKVGYKQSNEAMLNLLITKGYTVDRWVMQRKHSLMMVVK